MTTWTETEKYSTQESITYNEVGVTYNEAALLYSGKQGTVWTEQTEN